MKTLIKFESLKIIKSKYFLSLITLITIILCSYYSYNYVQTLSLDAVIQDARTTLEMEEERLALYEEEINEGNMNENSMEVEDTLTRIDFISERLQGYLDEDWERVTTAEYQRAAEEKERNDNIYSWPTEFTSEVRYEENKWLADHQLRPVFPIHYWSALTIYDEAFDSTVIEEEVHNFHNKHSGNSLYFLYNSYNLGFGIVGVAFLLFLFGDIITKESMGRNGTINFLTTQPHSHLKIITSKFLTVMIVTVGLLISLTFLGVLLGIVFDYFGEWMYPVLIYQPELSMSFIPMGLYLLYCAILFLLVVLFSYSLMFLFSVMTNRTSVALGLTLVTLIIGMQLNETIQETTFAAYYPFTYIDVEKIITQEWAALHDNFELTLHNGVISLLLSTIMIMTLTIKLFLKRINE
ncbi:ABC transporter permease [Alkalibacillus haloalkaliphilus]|uniref:ABC transporter permease n=1 Tax=Alkalibacillus haloalkaliphilus TaxID=94136 RepID=UPI00293593DD|nr:ABC transporter permease subunit [Alkalibacillus haloalkaliphilus]MDV2581651.1 ABC transporter permease subunit [Alkalibacillus haloalkaliphilus]